MTHDVRRYRTIFIVLNGIGWNLMALKGYRWYCTLLDCIRLHVDMSTTQSTQVYRGGWVNGSPLYDLSTVILLSYSIEAENDHSVYCLGSVSYKTYRSLIVPLLQRLSTSQDLLYTSHGHSFLSGVED